MVWVSLWAKTPIFFRVLSYSSTHLILQEHCEVKKQVTIILILQIKKKKTKLKINPSMVFQVQSSRDGTIT